MPERNREVLQVENFLHANIPPDIYQRLNTAFFTTADLKEILAWSEDSPHQFPHIIDTIGIYSYLARAYDLSNIDWNLGERAIRYHDMGYKLVERGLLEPKEHHYGSIYIASIIDPDIRLLEAVYHHVDDVLPIGTKKWARLVRDADRISSLGFTGANRLAYYFDYRDPVFEGMTSDQVLKTEIFCDLKPPPQERDVFWHPVYPDERFYPEKRARAYFFRKVLPFLHRNSLLDEYSKYMELIYMRFNGKTYRKSDLPDVDYPEARQSLFAGGWGKIEPVVEKGRIMFRSRAEVTRILSMAEVVLQNETDGNSMKKINYRKVFRSLWGVYDDVIV